MIISDQLNAFGIGAAGCETVSTPNIDRLAREGCRFGQSYTTYPLCVPWRSSMASGLYPHQFGLHGNNGGGRSPRDRENFLKATDGKTLYTQVRDAGYNCQFRGKWHMTMDPHKPDLSGVEYVRRGGSANNVKEVVELFEQQKSGDKPLFATLSIDTPHEICGWARKHAAGEHEDDKDLPPGSKCPALPENHPIPDDMPEALEATREGGRKIAYPTFDYDDEDWRQYIWAYRRYTEKMDEIVGTMLDTLAKTGHDKDTLVIFVADHGDGCAAHHWNQKIALWEECTRVPLIFRQPGVVKAGRVDGHLVATGLDLMPTLCEITGGKMPEGRMGKSLWSRAKGADKPTHEFVVTQTDIKRGNGWMVCSGRYKYVLYSYGKDREQLFDLEKDPGEMRNRIDEPALADVLARHREYLGQWSRNTEEGVKIPSA
jgi:arylsulfatase A-like enzyme